MGPPAMWSEVAGGGRAGPGGRGGGGPRNGKVVTIIIKCKKKTKWNDYVNANAMDDGMYI